MSFPHGALFGIIAIPKPLSAPQTQMLDLDDLLPAKASVATSLGTLYLRQAHVSDWKHLDSDDLAELGRSAVRQFASRIADKNDDQPLTNDDFDNLNSTDFSALAHAIAEQSDWGRLPVEAALHGLGQAVLAAKERERGRHKKLRDEIQKSIGGSYAFLEKSTLEKLQRQVAGLADIRASLPDSHSEAIKRALGVGSSTYDRMTGGLTGNRVSEATIRSFERATIPRAIDARADAFEGVMDKEARNKATGSASASYDQVLRDLAGGHLSEDASQTVDKTVGRVSVEKVINFKSPPIYRPTLPENTLIGRAAIESAENLRLLAQRMDGLVEVVVGLNQTLVTDVLPSWIKQVEKDQAGAKDSFDQAARGIRWTKWAVIASVLVTVLGTERQVSVAQNIDRENSVQQQKMLDVLREQLVVQQKFIEHQTRESQLRELLDAKLQAPAAKK